MKRYVLFRVDHYYPSGGFEDTPSFHDTVAEAVAVRDTERDADVARRRRAPTLATAPYETVIQWLDKDWVLWDTSGDHPVIVSI